MYGKKYLKKSLSMETYAVKDFKKKLKQVRKEMLAELPMFNDKSINEGWTYSEYEDRFNKRVNELIKGLLEIPGHGNTFELSKTNQSFILYVPTKRP